MDQILLILADTHQVGITLTNIQALGTGAGIIVSTLVMWGLMTKNINEKIKSKADESETKQHFESLEYDNKKQDELIWHNTKKIDDNYAKIDKKIDKIYEYIIQQNNKGA